VRPSTSPVTAFPFTVIVTVGIGNLPMIAAAPIPEPPNAGFPGLVGRL
jgi:hypothetical protein